MQNGNAGLFLKSIKNHETRWRNKQGQLPLHSELEAILDYKRLSHKTEIKTNEQIDKDKKASKEEKNGKTGSWEETFQTSLRPL